MNSSGNYWTRVETRLRHAHTSVEVKRCQLSIWTASFRSRLKGSKALSMFKLLTWRVLVSRLQTCRISSKRSSVSGKKTSNQRMLWNYSQPTPGSWSRKTNNSPRRWTSFGLLLRKRKISRTRWRECWSKDNNSKCKRRNKFKSIWIRSTQPTSKSQTWVRRVWRHSVVCDRLPRPSWLRQLHQKN